MNRVIRTLTIAFVVVLLVGSMVTVGSQSTNPTGTTASDESDAASASNSSNGTTLPRHSDPEKVRQSGDLDQVERWLEAKLARRLSDSSLRVQRGEYERARGLVGDRYSDMLGRYVEVQQSSNQGDGENKTERFRRGQKNQRTFVNSVREYRKTYDRYQEARRNGNTTQARKYARRLDQLAERTNRSATTLQSVYSNLSQSTPADLNRSSRQVSAVSQNVTETQESVERTVFVETDLNVTSESETVSFLDPMNVTGRITTANGSVLRGQNVTIAIANRTYTTSTDATGRFTVTYRPTTLPLNTKRLRVEYRPLNESAYLNANGSVPVKVTQVDSNVTLTKSPNRSAFDEEFSVSGVVGSNGVRAANVPVVIRAGGERIGRTKTGSHGQFSFRTRLPASVPAGERKIRVVVPLSDRALSSASDSAPMFVEQTNTSLSLNATLRNQSVRVRGQLSEKNGTAVPQRTVALRVDGTRVGTATTSPNGTYSATFELPPSVDRSESIEVVATFESSSSNLEGARATDVVEPESTDDGNRSWFVWIGAALITLALLVGTVFVRSRRDESDSDEDGALEETDELEVEDDETEASDEAEHDETDVIDAARKHLSAGRHERAIEVGYMALRRYLVRRNGLDSSATPRELLEMSESTISDREYQTLRELTRCYEQVAFASQSVDENTVSVFLDAVDAIVTADDSTDKPTGKD